MHPSRLVMLFGGGIGIVSLPFPFVDLAGTGSVSGFEGRAWPGALLLLVVILFALTGDRAEGLSTGSAVAAILAGGAAVLFAVLKLADASRATDIAGGASIGAGTWILLAASVVALVGTVLSLSRRLG